MSGTVLSISCVFLIAFYLGPSYHEPHCALHSLMATLSTGPVAPGDAIDKINKTLVMKSCNADGLILKPSRPAFPVDPQLWQVVYHNGTRDR